MTDNPYPGPRPFAPGEQLYGRDREVTRLFYLLSAERIVVLHSPSGAGKSSLLNAGLVPRLREDRFDVWPAIRLSQPADGGGNRFVRSAVASLEEGLPEKRRRPPGEIAGQRLAEYVAGRPRRPGAPPSVVLVFDQFEEILTVDPLGVEERQEFFRQLGDLLENTTVWALFALREDYLGALDPYRDDVPTRLGNTFRLDLLTVERAKDAIAEPARAAGREFAPAAVDELANDLATVSVQRADGGFEEQTGIYVEPLQLQVVCRRLWDELPDDARTIGIEDLRGAGDVDAALAAYYDGCLAEVAAANGANERGLREWFGEQLITGAGIRGQVLREQASSGGLDNEAVDRVVATHLVRGEQRDGKTWLELAHDRLVAPVRESNAAWFERNLHPMQRQAALWEHEGRPDSLLLRGQELEDAEAWAAANPASVRPVEQDLLADSVSQRQAERRHRTRLIGIAVALLVLAALFAAVGAWALLQRNHARNATTSAGALAASGTANDPTTPVDLSLLLGLAAYQARPASSAARGSAFSALSAARDLGVATMLHGHTDAVTDVAYSGHTVASSSVDGTVRLWDLSRRRPLAVLGGGGGTVNSVAFSRAGNTVASAGNDGSIRLWDVRSHRLLDTRSVGAVVRSLAFSRDGRLLAAAAENGLSLWSVGSDRRLRLVKRVSGDFKGAVFDRDGRRLATTDFDVGVGLWTVPALRRESTLWPSSNASFFGVAFSQDGRTLAAGADDGSVYVHGPGGNRVLKGHQGWVYGVAFSRDGTLASSSTDGTVRLWAPKTYESIRVLGGGGGAVSAVAFDESGHTLAAAGPDRIVRIWDVTAAGAITEPARVTSVLFGRDGRTLVTGGDDGTVRFWNLATLKPEAVLSGSKSPVTDLALSLDGSILASSGNDGTIRLWSMRTPRKPPLYTLDAGVPQVFLPPQAPRQSLTRVGAQPVLRVVFGPEKGTLVAVLRDGTVQLWSLRTRPPRRAQTIAPPDDFLHNVYGLAASPDGHTLAYGPDFNVRLQDLAKPHEPAAKLPGHTTWVTGLAFSPRDGATLASASWDGTVRLWDTTRKDHPLLRVLRSPSYFLESVAFGADGRTVAAGGDDAAVRLFDTGTGDQLGQPLRLERGYHINDVAFSPDGLTVAAASDSGTVGLWPHVLFRDLADLRTQVCGLVIGNLSRTEWAQYAPGVSYRSTCPG